jgi:formate dehydrogenase subunit gamma
MALILRFSRTERAAHWLVAAAFAVMLLSGTQVPHHWTPTTPWFDIHVGAAIVLVGGLAGLLLGRGGRRLWATVRELRRLDPADRAWLSPVRILQRRPPPLVGRFNGGQKMNARLALVGLTGLYISGLVLVVAGGSPLGGLHGPFAVLTSLLVAGHIYMAVLNPSTRPALRGMILGSVDRDWAEHHFPAWIDQDHDSTS